MKASELPILIHVNDGEGNFYPVSFGFDGLKISDNQKAIVMECIQSRQPFMMFGFEDSGNGCIFLPSELKIAYYMRGRLDTVMQSPGMPQFMVSIGIASASYCEIQRAPKLFTASLLPKLLG